MSRVTLIPATAEEEKLLGGAVAYIERVLDAADKFIQYAVEPPVGGSPIERAYAIDQREAFDLAYVLLFTAEDHLKTILIIIKAGSLPAFSLFTLLRTAAETAVRAKYLLEPQLTHEQRLGRALNERLENLREQDKLMTDRKRAGTADEVEIRSQEKHMNDRLAHMKDRAKAAGLSVLGERREDGSTGRITGFGEQSRSEWDLFNQFLPVGATVFRFLSGYVHARPWVQFPRYRAQPSEDPRLEIMPSDINIELFVKLLVGITILYDECLAHWMSLAGYPADVWRLAKAE